MAVPNAIQRFKDDRARAMLRAVQESMVTEAEVSAWRIEARAKLDRAKALRMERLAALEHEQWCFWVGQLIATGRIPDWLVVQWKRSMVPYGELPENSKEMDRVWARRVVDVLERAEE